MAKIRIFDLGLMHIVLTKQKNLYPIEELDMLYVDLSLQ